MKNIIIKKLFLKKSLSQVQESLFLSGQVFNFMQVGIFALFGLRTDTIVFCGFLLFIHVYKTIEILSIFYQSLWWLLFPLSTLMLLLSLIFLMPRLQE